MNRRDRHEAEEDSIRQGGSNVRPVYMVSGGVSKFAKARPDATFQKIVKESFDYAMNDVPKLKHSMIDGSVVSYFSDHFTRQLMAGIMATDYLGLCPKPNKRIEGGGATGGLCFQAGWEAVASGRMNVCAAFGFETMSHVPTWKGNEFIALASDVNFDYPVGGFYSGYYAMMVNRHMHEFGTTVEQLAMVSVKNHMNAYGNPYAQKRRKLTIADVRNSAMVAYPLTLLDICVMSDGAATCILADEETAFKLTDHPVKITGVGTRHRHDAHGGPAARRGDSRPEREEERLQEPEISRRPLLPGGTERGAPGVQNGGDHGPPETDRLRRTSRRLHLFRDPDVRGPCPVQVRRRREVRGIGVPLHAADRLRDEAPDEGYAPGEPLRAG